MRKLLPLLVLFLLILYLVYGWWQNQFMAVSNDKNSKNFIIAKGESVNDVAESLKKEGLIKNPFAFKFYLKGSGDGDKLQAGTFKLSPSMSIKETVEVLKGRPNDLWVTLLEGWRMEEMAERLNTDLRIKNEEFLKVAKEGYMFPDTYLFAKEVTAERIASIMRDNFERKYTPDLRAKIRSLGLTESQGVVLASIVEREARSDAARTMVASILLKRLKIDMGLNADATVQYALVPKGSKNPPAGGWWKRHLTKDDLKVSSPYNTYLYRGLPPTPICNPSLSSLKAVANSDPSTPYLYYYHDSKGNSYYAKTLDEHNQNVANNP
ncbi:endolytic transglycosylase MltG [Candidatus Daviesbacteria bacterium]|nr:endolytic transglycosylase MltG [Candidatus Daviesbacteria bacterium]